MHAFCNQCNFSDDSRSVIPEKRCADILLRVIESHLKWIKTFIVNDHFCHHWKIGRQHVPISEDSI